MTNDDTTLDLSIDDTDDEVTETSVTFTDSSGTRTLTTLQKRVLADNIAYMNSHAEAADKAAARSIVMARDLDRAARAYDEAADAAAKASAAKASAAASSWALALAAADAALAAADAAAASAIAAAGDAAAAAIAIADAGDAADAIADAAADADDAIADAAADADDPDDLTNMTLELLDKMHTTGSPASIVVSSDAFEAWRKTTDHYPMRVERFADTVKVTVV